MDPQGNPVEKAVGHGWLVSLLSCIDGPHRQTQRETGILLPNNQRQHRTSHAPKDVLPLGICANYCAPCQPLKPKVDVASSAAERGGNKSKGVKDSRTENGPSQGRNLTLIGLFVPIGSKAG